MKRLMRWVPLHAGLLILQGCISEPNHDRNAEQFLGLIALNDQWKLDSTAPHAHRPAVTMEKGPGGDLLVSIEADDLLREQLLHELLTTSGVSYWIDHVHPSGLASLRLHRVPFLEACHAILTPIEAEAVWIGHGTDRILRIGNRTDSPLEPGPAPETSLIAKTCRIQHLPATDLQGSLFAGSSSQPGGVIPSGSATTQVGIAPDMNALYFRGPADEVQRCLRMAKAADCEPTRIRMEVIQLIRRPDQDTLLLNPSEVFVPTPVGRLLWQPNAIQSSSGTTFPAGWALYTNPSKNVYGFVDYFGSHEISIYDALSQDTLLVCNGQSASIQLGRNGYLLVPQFSAGIPVGSIQNIVTGVKHQITATALPQGTIRVTLTLSNSRFTESPYVIADSTSNITQTVLQIPNGGWVIAGGLTSRSSENSSTWPTWIGKVPLVGDALSYFNDTRQREHTVSVLRFSIVDQDEPLNSPSILDNLPAILLSDTPSGLSNLGPSLHTPSPAEGS